MAKNIKVGSKPKNGSIIDPMMVSNKKTVSRSRVIGDTNKLYSKKSTDFDSLYMESERSTRRKIGDERVLKAKTTKTTSRARSASSTPDGEFTIYDKPMKNLSSHQKKKLLKRKKLQEKWDEKNRKRIAKGKLPKDYSRKMPVWGKIVISFLVLIIVGIITVLIYGYNILSRSTSIFQGNPFDILVKSELARDEYGRTNVLVYGTAEDDEGHGGALLTDSILVLSLDQDLKIASVFSIPRDLWVSYSIPGEDPLYCDVGYQGKVNATLYCALNAFNDDRNKASEYLTKKIVEITGVSIQYYVSMDFTVLKTVVDELGGIDVDVWATDERGIYDICQDNLELPLGMNYGLDGATVLRLSRARGAYGGYGLANSNFDREINQQRIINGIKNKAMNIGLLANPNKVFAIIDSLGENVKTNITMSEIRTFLDVVMGLNGEVGSIETKSIFKTGRIGEQSVVIPSAGSVDYPLVYTGIVSHVRAELDKATAKFKAGDSSTDSDDETDDTTDAGTVNAGSAAYSDEE